jgi:hypothetical protein
VSNPPECIANYLCLQLPLALVIDMQISLAPTSGVNFYRTSIWIGFHNIDHRGVNYISTFSNDPSSYSFSRNRTRHENDPATVVSKHDSAGDRPFNAKVKNRFHNLTSPVVLTFSTLEKYGMIRLFERNLRQFKVVI